MVCKKPNGVVSWWRCVVGRKKGRVWSGIQHTVVCRISDTSPSHPLASTEVSGRTAPDARRPTAPRTPVQPLRMQHIAPKKNLNETSRVGGWVKFNR